MSPIWYQVNVDEQMKVQMKSELGCMKESRSYCALFQVDDIIMLSRLVSKIQKMLNISNEYGKNIVLTLTNLKQNGFVLMYTVIVAK